METGSILIKEKRKCFTKRQTGCLKCFGAQALEFERVERIHRSIYRDNEVYSLSYNIFVGSFKHKRVVSGGGGVSCGVLLKKEKNTILI